MNGGLHVPLIIKSYPHVHLHYLHNEWWKRPHFNKDHPTTVRWFPFISNAMSGKMIISAHLSACVWCRPSFSPILIAYEQRRTFTKIGSEFSLSSATPSCKRVLMIHLINLNSMEAMETAQHANPPPNHEFSWWRIPEDMTFVHCRTPFRHHTPIPSTFCNIMELALFYSPLSTNYCS